MMTCEQKINLHQIFRFEKVTMNKYLGVIMPTENINRNPSSTTPSQTVASRSTDFASTMPVANKRSEGENLHVLTRILTYIVKGLATKAK